MNADPAAFPPPNPQDRRNGPEVAQLHIPEASRADITSLSSIVIGGEVDFNPVQLRPVVETIDTGKPLVWEQVDGRNYLPGNKLLTDLPPEVFGTRATEDPRKTNRIAVLPSRFDPLPEGSYRISDPSFDCAITIAQTDKGTYFTINEVAEDEVRAERDVLAGKDTSYPQGRFMTATEGESNLSYAAKYYPRLEHEEGNQSPTIDVLLAFGYIEREVNGRQLLLHPTPSTLARLAAEQGIPIKLIDQTNDGRNGVMTSIDAIAGHDFGQAFAEGTYPVGSRELWYYGHDTTNDHFPAVIVGGKPMLDLLAPYVADALQEGRDVYSELDQITSYLTDVLTIFGVENNPQFDPRRYLDEAEGMLEIISDGKAQKGALTEVYVQGLENMVAKGALTGIVAENVRLLSQRTAHND